MDARGTGLRAGPDDHGGLIRRTGGGQLLITVSPRTRHPETERSQCMACLPVCFFGKLEDDTVKAKAGAWRMTRHCSVHTLAATPATAIAGLVYSVSKRALLFVFASLGRQLVWEYTRDRNEIGQLRMEYGKQDWVDRTESQSSLERSR